MFSDKHDEYEESPKGAFYKRNVTSVGGEPWFKGIAAPKHLIATISRLRSNEAVCGSYLHRIGKRVTPLCSTCGEMEDFKHIVMICPRFSDDRKVLFAELYKLINGPFQYEEIVFSNKYQVLKLLYEFTLRYIPN